MNINWLNEEVDLSIESKKLWDSKRGKEIRQRQITLYKKGAEDLARIIQEVELNGKSNVSFKDWGLRVLRILRGCKFNGDSRGKLR